MCGIYGIISHNIFTLIVDGLKQLQNRGYDSSGICTIHNTSFNIIKSCASNSLDVLSERAIESNIGMGHNRWATHGSNTPENTHPHISNDQRWAIVHNGIIENYSELKSTLLDKGYTFYSETDTEVVCNLLQANYQGNVYKAIEQTLTMLRGTYAFIIMSLNEPDNLYCVVNQSPLLVGYDEDKIIITSEKSGFCFDVKYIILKENDICCINKDFIFHNDQYTEYDHFVQRETEHEYPHWTLKEIHEQPEAVLRICPTPHEIEADNIVLLGCGTSYHAALYGSHFFKQTGNYNTVQVFDGADFTIQDIPKTKTAYILISQSGETLDLYQCLNLVTGTTYGIINVEDSLIAREVDHVIYTNAGKEVGVASVKSFTNQVISLALLAGIAIDLPRLSADIQTTIHISVPVCQSIVNNYNDSVFLIGKGKDEIIAKEGALKIKEISYLHAEGYSASSLKHGPFALLDENMPTIIVALENNLSTCYQEVKARHSPIFYITNRVDDKADLIIPEHGIFSSLLGMIPLQLLAYYISLKKGINPDKPKNLAKVVTVL